MIPENTQLLPPHIFPLQPVRYTQKSQPKKSSPHNPDKSKPNFPEETSKPVRFNQQLSPDESKSNEPDGFILSPEKNNAKKRLSISEKNKPSEQI